MPHSHSLARPRCTRAAVPCRVQRSKSSTFARLSRSVSKLGSRTGRPRQQASIPESLRVGEAPAQPPDKPVHRHSGSGDAPAPSVTFAAGPAGGRVAPRGSGGGVGAAGGSSAAARLRLFEEGRFDLEASLGSLTGELSRYHAVQESVICYAASPAVRCPGHSGDASRHGTLVRA